MLIKPEVYGIAGAGRGDHKRKLARKTVEIPILLTVIPAESSPNGLKFKCNTIKFATKNRINIENGKI
jgi:hypothetical protein